MNPSYFSPDILEFIRLLSIHKVRYLIVGGEAVIIQFGRPPNRIDLINDISGVIFEKAWPNRTLEEVEIKDQKYFVCYIGLEDLIKNKRNAKRYKDLEDLKYLTALDKKK
jgi:predicted nucleotidyltransferase